MVTRNCIRSQFCTLKPTYETMEALDVTHKIIKKKSFQYPKTYFDSLLVFVTYKSWVRKLTKLAQIFDHLPKNHLQ